MTEIEFGKIALTLREGFVDRFEFRGRSLHCQELSYFDWYKMACTPEQARLNSQKSTGPKTARGKAIVSQNARKHGLTSRKPPLLAQEDVLGFRQLFQGLMDRYQPTDPIQHHLIEKIAMGIHRQRRLWYAEITIESDSVPEPVELIEKREIWEYFLANLETYGESGRASRRSKYFPIVWARYCRQSKQLAEFALSRLIPPKTPSECLSNSPEFSQSCELSPIAAHQFEDNAYVELERFNFNLDWEIEAISKNDRHRPFLHSFELVGTVRPTNLRAKIGIELKQIEAEIADFRDAAIERQRNEGLVKVLTRADLIARYESHLSRELREAISELERLQGVSDPQ